MKCVTFHYKNNKKNKKHKYVFRAILIGKHRRAFVSDLICPEGDRKPRVQFMYVWTTSTSTLC